MKTHIVIFEFDESVALALSRGGIPFDLRHCDFAELFEILLQLGFADFPRQTQDDEICSKDDNYIVKLVRRLSKQIFLYDSVTARGRRKTCATSVDFYFLRLCVGGFIDLHLHSSFVICESIKLYAI